MVFFLVQIESKKKSFLDFELVERRGTEKWFEMAGVSREPIRANDKLARPRGGRGR